jgi:hypothetical protein
LWQSCHLWHNAEKYRVSIKSFLDYKHLLQENYVEYKKSICWSVLICCKKTSWVELHFEKNIYVYIPRSFLVINVFNQGKTLCLPYIAEQNKSQTTIWRTRIAYYLPKVIITHSEYVTLFFLHCTNGCSNAPHYYVIRT